MTESQETQAIRPEAGAEPGREVDEGAEGERTLTRNGMEPAHHARRPMNAFLIFCKRHRSVVRDKYPNLENRSITKILGEWWANLEKDEKACYTGLAKQYKDAFFTAHPNFKWYKLPAPPLRIASRPGTLGGPTADRDMFIDNELHEIKVEQTNNNHLTKVNYNAHPSTSTSKELPDGNRQIFTPGKLADEAQMGGISSLILSIKNSNEDSLNDRNITPLSPATSQHSIFLESPKFKASTPITMPNPPKKRTFSEESEDMADRNNYYKSDEVSPPRINYLSAEEVKLQKLQDELSKTSQVFKHFDSSNKSENAGDKSASNGSKTTTPQNSSTGSGFDSSKSVNSPKSYEEFSSFKRNGSESSDESQDKDSQRSEESHAFGKNKSAWNIFTDQLQNKGSGRACKGKRYQEFMVMGGLIVNKRQKKEHMERKPLHLDTHSKLSYEVNGPTCSWNLYDNYPKQSPGGVLGNDESDLAYSEQMDPTESAYNKIKSETDDTGQIHYYGENAMELTDTDGQANKMFTADDFDLDAKIMALPSLSLEKFQQKKKENKKRKKTMSSSKHKDAKPRLPVIPQHHFANSTMGPSSNYLPSIGMQEFNSPRQSNEAQTKLEFNSDISSSERMYIAEQRKSTIIGSKKRKPRKISITRRDVNSSNCKEIAKNNCTNSFQSEITPTSTNVLLPDQNTNNDNVDLCALTTLAEVAANTSKINEET